MTKIKAIVFDMDGVLIDAREWHFEALNRALSLIGFEISRYEHLVTYDGLPTRKKLEMLTKERGLPVKLHEFISALKQKYTMEVIYAKCRPSFQHQYALSRLRRDGFKLAVASNSIRQTVETMMEYSALRQNLDILLSNQDVSKPKPSPEIYLRALELLSVRAEECVIVEDNPNGIEAARRSGCHVMEVADVDDVSYQRIRQFIAACG